MKIIAKNTYKLIAGYGISNALNTVAMILFLPTLIHLNNESGVYVAKGMLGGQVTSIFAAYTFSLTLPRTLENIQVEIRRHLIFEVLAFQVLVGILGISAFFIVQSRFEIFELFGFFIVFSAVFQWQWFHITNKKASIQTSLIITTRILLISYEIIILLNLANLKLSTSIFLSFSTLLICIPIVPTFLLLEKIDINKKIGALIYSEIKNGKHLFSASLLTSIYSVGPSLVVANINPQQLVFIQQFDRVRLAVSNMAGLILNGIYPFLLSNAAAKLISGFLNVQKYILIPAIFCCLLILMACSFLTGENLVFLGRLQMDKQSLALALIAGILASSSNTILLTFLHIIKIDHLYFNIIFIGAFIFIFLTLFSYYFLPLSLMVLILMAGVCGVELFINLQLWIQSKKIINNF